MNAPADIYLGGITEDTLARQQNMAEIRAQILGDIASTQAVIERENRRPILNADEKDLTVITPLAWNALALYNDPPLLFQRGGVPVRLDMNEKGIFIVRDLAVDVLRHESARSAYWVTKHKQREFPAMPPVSIIKDMLACSAYPLPVLRRITAAPVFGPSGEIQTEPGYHAGSQTFFLNRDNLNIEPVPKIPSIDDIEKARAFLLEIYCDFPFVAEADRTHAIAMMLLPFVRSMIDGPTPLHDIEASEAGTGKGLLASVAITPATGGNIEILAKAKDEDEVRKRITSIAREGAEAVLFDNEGNFHSAVVAAALTADIWKDRILGKSETSIMPLTCVWILTANNPTFSTEIARRCVRIRLESTTDRPWLREGFKHSDLRGWVRENRADIIHACLVIIQAWISAGRPKPKAKSLGSFEAWAEVMGGILEHAGFPDFLGNILLLYEQADTDGAAWRQLVCEWFDKYGPEPVRSKELFEIANSIENFPIYGKSERAQQVAFGKALSRQHDRVFGNYRIKSAGTYNRAAIWCLAHIGEENLNLPFEG